MKTFNYLTAELLTAEEMSTVKGGYNIPTPIIITE